VILLAIASILSITSFSITKIIANSIVTSIISS
jgi:hypothetical protein